MHELLPLCDDASNLEIELGTSKPQHRIARPKIREPATLLVAGLLLLLLDCSVLSLLHINQKRVVLIELHDTRLRVCRGYQFSRSIKC